MSLRQLGIFLIFFGFSLGFFSSRFDFQSSQAGVVDVQSFGPGLNNSLSLQLAFSLHDSHSQNEFIERLNFFAAVLSKSPQITGVFYGTVEFLKDKNLKDWLVKEMNQRGVQSDRFHLVQLQNEKEQQPWTRKSASVPISFEVSKNTSTDDGLCLVTANREQVETNATSSLCRKIIKLPALPLEISQETPSYLKILSNRKVMLGRYPDSVVVVSDIIETIEFRCDFEEAETPQTYFDCIKSSSSTPQKYEANLQVIDYKDALKYVKSGFSIAAWDVFAESPIGRLPIEGLIDQAKWQEHYDSSKRILEQNGFEVVTIEQPYPFLEIKKLSFRSPSGILLKTEINTELHFFSFANSLILGSTAFVPTFQYDDFKFANHHELQLKLQTLNNKAIQLYEDEGFHTEAIVADKMSKETGGMFFISRPIISSSEKFR